MSTPRTLLRRGTEQEAAEAVAILREAAAWSAALGVPVWHPHELELAPFAAAASAGELVLGLEDDRPVATMLLQSSDRRYWPEDAPGTALYLHKVAVRRASAGRGWVDRFVDAAAGEARAAGVPYLKLDTLDRPPLQQLYERLGFRRLDEPTLPIGGREYIRMVRVLDAAELPAREAGR